MATDDFAPILQTLTALEIDTPQFYISLPGTWTEEQNPDAENVVYCGRCGDRWVSISLWLFTKRLTLEERKETLAELLDMRKSAEARVSHGEAETEIGPPYDNDDLVMATSFSSNLSMGLASFTRLIADSEKALCVYWQVDGFSDPPNLSQLFQEFEGIVGTAGLYLPEPEL